jgi:hypothetical protein
MDKNVLDERRKDPRYQSLARAIIEGIDLGEVLLKDLSITGCNIESSGHPQVKTGARYKIEVFPESASNIGKFELKAELIWIENEADSAKYGFNILKSPKGKFFQNYVDYLAWRSEAGEDPHS